MDEGGVRLSSRMPAWVTLKLIPGVVIFACGGLAAMALAQSEWRGALLLLGLLGFLCVLTFGLVRHPAADQVLDGGDHLDVRLARWQGRVPLDSIDSVTFRPALNGRVVTLHMRAGKLPAEAWVFVPRLVLRSGVPADVQALQQRVQQRQVARTRG